MIELTKREKDVLELISGYYGLFEKTIREKLGVKTPVYKYLDSLVEKGLIDFDNPYKKVYSEKKRKQFNNYSITSNGKKLLGIKEEIETKKNNDDEIKKRKNNYNLI